MLSIIIYMNVTVLAMENVFKLNTGLFFVRFIYFQFKLKFV